MYIIYRMYSMCSLDFIFMTAFVRFDKVVNHAILSSVHQDHGAHRAFEMDLEHEGTRTMDDQDAKAKAWSRHLARHARYARYVLVKITDKFRLRILSQRTDFPTLTSKALGM